jgi:hypothetical protein
MFGKKPRTPFECTTKKPHPFKRKLGVSAEIPEIAIGFRCPKKNTHPSTLQQSIDFERLRKWALSKESCISDN